jgi:hypothetical protein
MAVQSPRQQPETSHIYSYLQLANYSQLIYHDPQPGLWRIKASKARIQGVLIGGRTRTNTKSTGDVARITRQAGNGPRSKRGRSTVFLKLGF